MSPRIPLVRAGLVALLLVGWDLYDSQLFRAQPMAFGFRQLEAPSDAPHLTAVFAFVVALCAFAVASFFRAVTYLRRAGRPTAETIHRTMQDQQIDASWIKSGKPVFKGTEISRSPDGRTASGMWSCDGPATFEWQYGCDETICVIEGRAEIDYLGKRLVLEPGDSIVFHSGTRALWHVAGSVRKVYTLQELELPVRVWRRLLRVLGLR